MAWAMVVCWLCISPPASGQQDTVSLRSVDVEADALPWRPAGTTVTGIDSLSRRLHGESTLATLLQDENIAVKTYGANGTATLSLRGTEARHSAVLWNGFSINSASLGLTDLSMVPAAFCGDIALVRGSSASYGTPVIGGLLSLDYRPPSAPGWQASVDAHAGSYGRFGIQPSFRFTGRHFATSAVLLSEQSRNDYPYVNRAAAGHPEQRISHAFYRNVGLVQYMQWLLPGAVTLRSGIWLQAMDREIPPPSTIPASAAQQQDSLLRLFVSAHRQSGKSTVAVRAAWFDERQHYADATYGIDAMYAVRSLRAQADYRYRLSRSLTVRAATFFDRYLPRIAEYDRTVVHSDVAALAEASLQLQRNTRGFAGLRASWRNGTRAPAGPTAGIEHLAWKGRLTLKASAGRVHRFPSLNDLYWQPGGNPALRAESSWSFSGGYRLRLTKAFEAGQEAYSMYVTDWIQWQPTAFGYYAPVNIDEVHAWGVENVVRVRLPAGRIESDLSLRYAFGRSTTRVAGNDPAGTLVGKQLVYVPRHTGTARLAVRYGPAVLVFSYRYTGARYMTADNGESLPAYGLVDVALRLPVSRKAVSLEPYVSLFNVFDTAYESIPFRPEPGMHVRGGLIVTFVKTLKTHE